MLPVSPAVRRCPTGLSPVTNGTSVGIWIRLSNTKEFQVMKHVKKLSKLNTPKLAVLVGEKAPKGEKKAPEEI